MISLGKIKHIALIMIMLAIIVPTKVIRVTDFYFESVLFHLCSLLSKICTDFLHEYDFSVMLIHLMITFPVF